MKIANCFMLAGMLLLVASCSNDDDYLSPVENIANVTTPEYVVDGEQGLGWDAEGEDFSTMPVSTNFGFENTDLPASVDLTPWFPPIGNQGQTGTCVAWSVAYNVKSAINAIDFGLGQSELSSPENQFSPKDLFMAIPDQYKKNQCNGVNFVYALDVMQNRGVASMASAPYENLGDCSNALADPAWTSEAAQNKIKYYRRIDDVSVESIKRNLANNVPVIFGADIYENFQPWRADDAPLSSNQGQKRGGHAMAIAGYDDAMQAFRVVNSWGTVWGDNGYWWVDYNFMANQFISNAGTAKAAFIMANEDGNVEPPQPDPSVSGVDLAPWVFGDYSIAPITFIPNQREISFNVYNIGDQAATPDVNWSMYYLYLNAYDANDYGIIFFDEFNTSVAAGSYACPDAFHCVINTPIPPGSNFGVEVFGTQDVTRTYLMPLVTGAYYLVLIVDATDVFPERAELNNLFYTSSMPIGFFNGEGKTQPDHPTVSGEEFSFRNSNSQPDAEKLQGSRFNTAVNEKFKNAYTSAEVLEFVKKEWESGRLRQRVPSGGSGTDPYGR